MKTRTPIAFPSGAASDLFLSVPAFVNRGFFFHYDKLLEFPLAVVFTRTITPWDLKMFPFSLRCCGFCFLLAAVTIGNLDAGR